ncbi:MAG: endonuclease III domain-containing protein [Patescibacteria group bacterium]
MKQVWAIVQALEERYGTPRLGNLDDPLDELVLIIVSARTREEVYLPVFQQLRRVFPDWNALDRRQATLLKKTLHPAGLGTKKSEAILSAFDLLRNESGSVSLEQIRDLPDELLEEQLLELPGVDRKTARCIMLFSFGRQVLPVDAHVFRVSRRLGLTDSNRADLAHRDLDMAIAPSLRHSYHVSCISHGRQVCRPKNPRCSDCCIVRFCSWARS